MVATGPGSRTGSFDNLIQVLVLDAAYKRVADSYCSASTIRRRRDEWITAGVFETIAQLCLEAYDRIVGLDLENLTVDGCITRARCGGEAAGKSPVDRENRARNARCWSTRPGVPLGCVVAPANHDSPLLRPTLEKLGRFETSWGAGLPKQMTVHLDAGYDSTRTATCWRDWAAMRSSARRAPRCRPLPAG